MLSIGQAARLLGVSVDTLRKWDKNKTFVATRTPSGQRRYSNEQIQNHRTNNQHEIEIITHCVKPSKLLAVVQKACSDFDLLKKDKPVTVIFSQSAGYNGACITLKTSECFTSNSIPFQHTELLRYNEDEDEVANDANA